MDSSQHGEWRKKPLYYHLISIVLGCILALASLEAFFRLLPVGNAPLLTRIDNRYGVKHFVPNDVLEWSTGTTFTFRTNKRTNNFGFPSDYDFYLNTVIPLLVVVGDSYVEAAQVPNSRSHHSLLNAGLGNGGRVYGIGSSGSALANYLQYAKMARERFSPDGMVFVIVGNDFDESMCQYHNAGRGMWCFGRNASGQYEMKRVYPPHALLRGIARQSALLRYLVFNAQIDWRSVFDKFTTEDVKERSYVGNTEAEASPERLAQSRIAVDEFFNRLPAASGLGAGRISFVVDAIRQAIYGEGSDLSESYFWLMRRYFMRRAQDLGYEVIDLRHDFLQDYVTSHEKFEFPIDGHWNELGHYLVAQAIANSKVFQKIFRVKPHLASRPSGLLY